MNNATVSIVTPLFNSQDFMMEAVESIKSQSFFNWELWLIDDFSTDRSAEIAQRLSDEDPRINLIRLSENSGAAIARNAGIEASNGRYIAFLDSDDLWLPNKLEIQLAFMRRTKAVLSYTGYEKIDIDGECTGDIVIPAAKVSYQSMLKANRIGCLTAMYDTKITGKVHMPLIRKRQDYALWLKILKKHGEAKGVQEVLASYRERNGSISSDKVEMLKYNWRVYNEFEGFSKLRSTYYVGCNILNKLLACY